jgi:hypothetical protein
MGYSQPLHTELMLLTFVDGAFERKEISGFLSANKLPPVVTFSHETASAIFEDEVSRQVRAVILSAHHLV